MGKFAQVVMGPAGSGKSTYCQTLHERCENGGRVVHVVNLDPAAEHFGYQPAVDIRTLISLDDTIQALNYGPNGGLVYCMEYLVDNMEWLEESVGEYGDDYLIFDCPGQIELYSHLPVMKTIVSQLQQWGYTVCAVYLLDSQFVADPTKFISGMLMCLSAMVRLEVPHVNVLTKIDLLKKSGLQEDMLSLLEPSVDELTYAVSKQTGPHFAKLNRAIGELLDEYSMVSFVPLDITSEDSVSELLLQVDTAVQYGEDLEPKEPHDELEVDL